MADKIRGPKDNFPEVRDEDGRILTPADFDRWETPPGAITFQSGQEEAPEGKPVAKSYEEIRGGR